ncbi:hypothetical protein B0H14DRAFT_3535119 [Mycena olivaceomarginata]|nr:hypothetical protein B0H14DRAFT_3535119 [Mycena olivaceomarginata]
MPWLFRWAPLGVSYTIINPAHCAPAVHPLRTLLKAGQSTTSGWMDSPVASPSPPPSFSCVQQYPSPVPLTPSLGCSPSSTESLSGDHPDVHMSTFMDTNMFPLSHDVVTVSCGNKTSSNWRTHSSTPSSILLRPDRPMAFASPNVWPWSDVVGRATTSNEHTPVAEYAGTQNPLNQIDFHFPVHYHHPPNPCSSLHAFTHFPALLNLPWLNLVDSAALARVLTQFAQPALARAQVVRGSMSPTPNSPAPDSPSPAPAPLPAPSPMPITPESPTLSTDSPARGLLRGD